MNQMDDSVFEALFRQAVIDDYNDELNSIPPREKLMETISFSKEFERKMKKLFSRDERREFLKSVLNYSTRVAAIFAVTITILFGLLLLNKEVRAAVKNTVIEWYDKFTSIIFHNEDSTTDENKEWKPGYLPSGYNDGSVETLGRIINIEFVNDQGDTIRFSYRPGSGFTNISVDDENHIMENDTINGYTAYILRATDSSFENGITWSMNGYIFSIWSRLPVDELKMIAQSID